MQLQLLCLVAAFAVSIATAGPLLSIVPPAGPMLVCDSSGDKVVRLEDVDGSGFVEPDSPGEITTYYDDFSPGPDLSTPSHLLVDKSGRVLLVDGGASDFIGVLSDPNADGDAQDENELRTFYDTSTGGPRLSTPNTLVLLADGSILVADDGSGAKRILRLHDDDGNGDALGDGEVKVVYDASALSLPVLADIEAITVTASGALVVGETTLQALFRLTDLTGDGDYLDENEVVELFHSTEQLALGDIDALASDGAGTLSCDSDTGRVLRFEDRNGDGDAQDEGEATIYFGEGSPLKVTSVTDILPQEGGGFIFLDNGKDSVVLVQDLNRDGDVHDEGEAVRWLADAGATLATPSGVAILPKRDEPPPQPVFLRGDVTGDGRLDISDPVSILGFLFLGRPAEVCIDAYDTNDTGDLNISDAISLLLYLFGGGAAPPAPLGVPGPDPTDDPLRC